MKKSLLVLGLAVAAFTSCSNDEVLDINKNTNIGFDAFVNKGTRAVTETNASLTKFYVYGYHGSTTDFAGTQVTGTVGGGVWSYANPVPWTDNTYQFAACANNNDGAVPGGVSFADKKLTITDYSISDANDLVAALALDVDGSAKSTVDFDFKHLLSRIKFQFTHSTDYDVEIPTITIQVKKSGTCTYDNSGIKWISAATAADLQFTGTWDGKTYKTDDHLVMPGQELNDITATFDVVFKVAGTSDVVDTKKYTDVSLKSNIDTWLPGYYYTYTAAIAPTTTDITFSCSAVTGWDTTTNPPYNN